MAPRLNGIDHVHVYVSDRVAAEDWYRRVLGFTRDPDLESWAVDGGPLTIGSESGSGHLALFEKPRESCRSTIALGVSGTDFVAWRGRLESALGRKLEPVDHELSWSLYFEDSDGNPFEITSYDHGEVLASLHGQAPNPFIEATS